MEVGPGTVVGRYEVVRFLGAGGMGEVYLAKDRDLARPVALKRVARDLVESSGGRNDLRDEARAAARLNHPAIAAVHDTFEHAGEVWLVMEYVEGESLAMRIARGPASVEQLVSLAAQLAEAVAHAHARGIIHRDLKPANVQLTPDGRVKILDFGVARRRPLADVSADPSRATTVRVVGTPRYMAPEGFAGRADEKSDIYSLGVLLFEFATGRPPFAGDDLEQLLEKVRAGPRPPLDAARPDLPSGVAATIMQMMEPEPLRRPAADAVAVTLAGARAALASGETVVAPARAGAGRTGRRGTYLWWGAGAAVAGLALFAILSERTPERPPTYRVAVLAPHGAGSSTPSSDLSGVAARLARYLTLAPGVFVLDDGAAPDGRAESSGSAGLPSDLLEGAAERGADLAVSLSAPDDRRIEALVWDVRAGRQMARVEEADLAGPAHAPAYRLADAVLSAIGAHGRRPASSPRALPSTQHAADDYLRGVDFLAERYRPLNVDRAIQAFTSATAADDGFAPAYAGLGSALLLKFGETADDAHLKGAEAAIERARGLDGAHPKVVTAHARLLARGSSSTEAVILLRAHLDAFPLDEEAHRLLGTTLLDRQQVSEALPHLERAVALRPSDWQNHSELGFAHLVNKDYGNAVRSYSMVIHLAPESSWGYQMRGTAYQLMGCEGLALADYDTALMLTPDAFVYSNKGTIHYAAGDYAEAARAYERAIELNPASPELRKNLGDAYAHLGRPDAARRAWSAGADICRRRMTAGLTPAYSEALLGLFEARLGMDAASARADRAAAADPTNPDVLYLAAVTSALAGRADRACQYTQQALSQGAEPNVVCGDEELRGLRECAACGTRAAESKGGCA